MKPFPLALGVLTLTGFAAIIGLWLYSTMPITTLLYVFVDAELITKMVDMLVMLMLAGALFLPKGRRGELLMIVGWLALGLGLLGTLFKASMIMRAIQMTGTTNLRVIAPGLAEGLLPVTLGLLTMTIAAVRAGKRPAEA